MPQKPKKGQLYLIPNIIAGNTVEQVLPLQIRQIVESLDYYLVENIRSARRFISALKTGKVIDELHFEILHNKLEERIISSYFEPIIKGKNAGVISESGCPAIADPGASAVAYAHKKDIRVIPLVGPSSLLLALMASGLNGQSFTFHGYLPIPKNENVQKIKALEALSGKLRQTQLFIETPYRNNQLFDSLLVHCRPTTQICVAQDITGESEYVKTMSVADWRKKSIHFPKVPVVFLLLASQEGRYR